MKKQTRDEGQIGPGGSQKVPKAVYAVYAISLPDTTVEALPRSEGAFSTQGQPPCPQNSWATACSRCVQEDALNISTARHDQRVHRFRRP